MCVRFFLVQLGVESTCNVIERVSLVNFFLQFSGRAFGNLFDFLNCWNNFEARFQRDVGLSLLAF